MRALLLSVLSIAVAAGVAFGATSGEPKKPKPVDVKKEMEEKCGGAPYGLVDLNGKTATKEEMEEAKFQVTSFITQVDVYQDCMIKLATSLKDRLSPNDQRIMSLSVAQSQAEKEAVGASFNNAVCEYNQAHNIPDKDCVNGKWKAAVVESPSTNTAAKPAKPATPKPAATTTTTTAPAKPKTP